MTVTKVGSAVTYNSGSSNILSTTGVDLAIAPASGNTLVVFGYMRGSTTTAISVTATGGTATFSSQIAQSGVSTYLHIQTATNVGAGITSINITPNVSVRGLVWVQEYSGVNNAIPMDVTPTGGTETTTTTHTTQPINPVTAGSMVLTGIASTVNTATAPQTMTTAGPTAHTGTQSGYGWNEEYDVWNGQSTGSANMAIGSACVIDLGAYQADWTTISSQIVRASIVLRPSSPSGVFFSFF